jgi:hypothetical protein
MTETTPEYRREDDQILALVETLRQEVMSVLAPRLAYHVDIACRLIEGYRLRERRAAVIRRAMDDAPAADVAAQARQVSELLGRQGGAR